MQAGARRQDRAGRCGARRLLRAPRAGRGRRRRKARCSRRRSRRSCTSCATASSTRRSRSTMRCRRGSRRRSSPTICARPSGSCRRPGSDCGIANVNHRPVGRRDRRRVRRREGERRRARKRLGQLARLHAAADQHDQLRLRPTARPGHPLRRRPISASFSSPSRTGQRARNSSRHAWSLSGSSGVAIR